MPAKKNITGLTIIYFIGSVASKAFSFLLFFALTFLISKNEIGEFDLIINSLTFFVPFISLQVSSSVFRWLIAEKDELQKAKIIENSISLLIFNTFLYSIIFWCLHYFFSIKYAGYIYLLTVLNIYFGYFQTTVRGLGNSKLYAFSGVLYALLNTILSLLFVFFYKKDIESLLIANCISLLILTLFVCYKSKIPAYFSFSFDIAFLKQLLSYSIPLLLNSLSWWIISTSNRYVILHYLGIEKNGIYAVSNKYTVLLFMLSDIFYLVWQEKFISKEEHELDKKYASDVLARFIDFLFPLLIVLASLSRFMLAHSTEKSFAEAWQYTWILLYSGGIQSIVTLYGVFYLNAKKTKLILYTSLLGVLFTVAASFLLIKPFGLYGVSIATLLGFLTVFLFRLKQIGSITKIRFPFVRFSLFTIGFVLVSLSNYYLNPIILVVGFTSSLIVFLYYNWYLINKVLKRDFSYGE